MKYSSLLLLVLLFLPVCLIAQNKTYKNEAGFQTDNDGFLAQGSDRYYTAGNYGYFRHALKVKDADTNFLKNKVLGFELGQKIYTPQSGYIPSAQYVDRPFAGYLYLATNLNLLYKNESNLNLIAQVGYVGPRSYAQQIQALIHRAFGFYTPAGWQYQVQNDLELNLSAEYNKLLYRTSSIDLSLCTNAALGNGYTGAGIGGMARIGTFNQLFNSVSTFSTVSRASNTQLLNDHELFFYYKPTINYIAYNATIQGSLFSNYRGPDEITLTKKPVVFSQQIGGSFEQGHWIVGLSAIFETSEVKEMVITGHQWGCINLLYRFN